MLIVHHQLSGWKKFSIFQKNWVINKYWLDWNFKTNLRQIERVIPQLNSVSTIEKCFVPTIKEDFSSFGWRNPVFYSALHFTFQLLLIWVGLLRNIKRAQHRQILWSFIHISLHIIVISLIKSKFLFISLSHKYIAILYR